MEIHKDLCLGPILYLLLLSTYHWLSRDYKLGILGASPSAQHWQRAYAWNISFVIWLLGELGQTAIAINNWPWPAFMIIVLRGLSYKKPQPGSIKGLLFI